MVTEEDRARVRREIDAETERRMARPVVPDQKAPAREAEASTAEWTAWVQGEIDRRIGGILNAYAEADGQATGKVLNEMQSKLRAEIKSAIAEVRSEIAAEIRSEITTRAELRAEIKAEAKIEAELRTEARIRAEVRAERAEAPLALPPPGWIGTA